jgi:hypothetical protein
MLCFSRKDSTAATAGSITDSVPACGIDLLPSRVVPIFEKKTELGEGKAKRRLAKSAVRINNLDERDTHSVQVTI